MKQQYRHQNFNAAEIMTKAVSYLGDRGGGGGGGGVVWGMLPGKTLLKYTITDCF